MEKARAAGSSKPITSIQSCQQSDTSTLHSNLDPIQLDFDVEKFVPMILANEQRRLRVWENVANGYVRLGDQQGDSLEILVRTDRVGDDRERLLYLVVRQAPGGWMLRSKRIIRHRKNKSNR